MRRAPVRASNPASLTLVPHSKYLGILRGDLRQRGPVNLKSQGGGPHVLNNPAKSLLRGPPVSSLALSNSINGRALNLKALKGIIDAEGRLRAAEEEIAIGF